MIPLYRIECYTENCKPYLKSPYMNQEVTVKMQTAMNPRTIAYIERLKRPSQLYRLFGDDGALLYIGISTNAKRRIYQHKCTADWAHMIWRHTIEEFALRDDAIAAEEAAIKAEMPAYNIRFAGRKPRLRGPVQRRKRRLELPQVSFGDIMREFVETAHMIQTYDSSIEGAEAKANERFTAAMAAHKISHLHDA